MLLVVFSVSKYAKEDHLFADLASLAMGIHCNLDFHTFHAYASISWKGAEDVWSREHIILEIFGVI